MPTDPRFNDTRLGRTPTRKSLGKRVMSIFYRSEIGLPQDTIKSNTVVRIIVGLLLVHILIIAGVLVRDDLAPNYGTTAAESPSIDAPPPPALAANDSASAAPASAPAAPAAHGTQRPISLSLEPSAAAPAAPATPAAGSGNTATRITSISTPAPAAAGNLDEDIAEDPAESSTPTAARRNESNLTASSGTPGRYLVKSGDTLSSIAREHGLRLDTLRRANPSLRGNTLIAGSYLVIPDKNGRVADAQADSNSGSSEKTYTIKSGDTLGAVARKHGVSLQKLLDANNIAKKDANRIKIGQKIIIPE